MLPGGSTNVVCRTLGIPNDVVDATEHLLTLADDWAPRKIDLGVVDEPPLRLRLRGRDRRHRGRAGRRPPAAEVPRRPLLLQLGGRLGLLPQVPGQPRAGAGRDRRRVGRGRHRDRPELRPLHLLRQPADPGLRGDRDRRRHALDRGAQAGRPARHADPDHAASSARAGPPRATARSSTSTTSPRRRSPRSPRTRTARRAPSRSRSTATTSATAPGSSCAPTPAP